MSTFLHIGWASHFPYYLAAAPQPCQKSMCGCPFQIPSSFKSWTASPRRNGQAALPVFTLIQRLAQPTTPKAHRKDASTLSTQGCFSGIHAGIRGQLSSRKIKLGGGSPSIFLRLETVLIERTLHTSYESVTMQVNVWQPNWCQLKQVSPVEQHRSKQRNKQKDRVTAACDKLCYKPRLLRRSEAEPHSTEQPSHLELSFIHIFSPELHIWSLSTQAPRYPRSSSCWGNICGVKLCWWTSRGAPARPEESKHLVPGRNEMWSNYERAPPGWRARRATKVWRARLGFTLTNETKSRLRTRVWTRETKKVQNFCGRNRQRECVRACVRGLPRKRKALLLLWSPATWVIP